MYFHSLCLILDSSAQPYSRLETLCSSTESQQSDFRQTVPGAGIKVRAFEGAMKAVPALVKLLFGYSIATWSSIHSNVITCHHLSLQKERVVKGTRGVFSASCLHEPRVAWLRRQLSCLMPCSLLHFPAV